MAETQITSVSVPVFNMVINGLLKYEGVIAKENTYALIHSINVNEENSPATIDIEYEIFHQPEEVDEEQLELPLH